MAPVGAGEDSEALTRMVEVSGAVSFSTVGEAEVAVGVGVELEASELVVLEDVELALELVELEDEVEEVDVADELEEGTEEELQILTSFMKAVQLVSPCGSG